MAASLLQILKLLTVAQIAISHNYQLILLLTIFSFITQYLYIILCSQLSSSLLLTARIIVGNTKAETFLDALHMANFYL